MTFTEFATLHKLTIDCVFVPFSRSRSAVPNPTPDQRSLNWHITLKRKGISGPVIDYHQGIGYCPSYQGGRPLTVAMAEAIEEETETGRSRKGPLTPPTLSDVLYSLQSDADVLDYASFVKWAHEFDYNPDSIAGRAVYDACLTATLQLRACLGGETFEALFTCEEH